MKILILVAGTNDPSNSDFLADRFAEGIGAAAEPRRSRTPVAEVKKVLLKDVSIDHFQMKYYDAATDQGEDFRRVEALMKNADGVVIATPIWNFGVPGHLKNLIDRMGSFCLDPETRSLGMLNGKPFFLIYTGGSPYPAWTGLQRRTVSHLPVSIRYFGGVVIGSHYEGRCTRGKGEFGMMVNCRPDSIASVKARGRHFAEVVKIFAGTGRLPLRERFLMWIFRTAQQIKRRLGL